MISSNMRKVIYTIIGVIFFIQSSGCAFMAKTETRQATGALSGILVGALVSGNIFGAFLGGMIGTVAGPLVGDLYDKKIGTRREAVLKHNYQNYGKQLYIEQARVLSGTPSHLATEVHVQYSILAPDDTAKIRIREARLLYNRDKGIIKLFEKTFIRSQGTYDTIFQIKLPEDFPQTDNTIITVIDDGDRSEMIELPLNTTT